MKNHFVFVLILGLVLFLSSSCQNKEEGQHAHEMQHAEGQHAHEAEETSQNYDCGNCGMPSQEYPQFHSKIKTEAGKEVWFCSTKCMFIATLKPKSILKNLAESQVMDYYDSKFISAKEAFYVTGSDVPGPMGADLIPHKSKEAAEEFMKEHKGKEILSFDEINMQVMKGLMK